MWLAGSLMLVALAEPPEDETAALDAYADRRLAVVEREVSTVYAEAYDGSGRFWFVEEGERRLLTAPQLAELVGDRDRATELRRRRTTTMTIGLGAMTLGSVGAVASLVSVTPQLEVPPALTLSGGAASALALVLGPVVLSRGVRSRHPSALYSQDEAQSRVEDYNAQLRDELLPR